ncbi:hypothetical protein BDZ91DRAFT_792102 [Kalaharituber pfeilii]|nr:hypothetical protein BDZ91DRAFT_792102 [Kalaharituber pfeilii]
MSSAQGPVTIPPYNSPGGASNGHSGVTSPRPQAQQPAHSALRSPTSEQQTRPQRTVRVQQPTTGQGPTIPNRTRATSSGAGQSSRVRQPTNTHQQAPTSHPHHSSRSAGHANNNTGSNIINNSNNNSNHNNGPEPPPRESSQSRSTNAAGTTTRNSSFPHAFERWEMLSSRWEGLTGYWISKLEQNRHELAHLPLEQQMSRQISDLSAAGANLFHAVVELQRLRASSERKFQRWFFETRADQERSREMSSELEANLRLERQKRADAMAVIARLEKEKTTAEKLCEEFRRELQISREECRRSWEELGRREQEERERRNSLREGNPTLVGDYQVLPMPMPGMPTRPSGSKRPQTSAGYADDHAHHDTAHLHHEPHLHPPHSSTQPGSSAGATAPSSSQQGSRSPISYPPPPGASTQRPGTSSSHQQFYQHSSNPNINTPTSPVDDQNRPYSPGQESFVTNEDLANQQDYRFDQPASPDYQSQRRRRADSVTETEMSDEEAINTVPGADYGGTLAVEYQRDEEGNLVLDSKGDPIIISYRHSRIDPEDSIYPDYEGSGYGAPIQAPIPPQGYGGYPGYGYGTYTGWEGITRHHHPTRLSDVVEEEERTHTSASDRSKKP